MPGTNGTNGTPAGPAAAPAAGRPILERWRRVTAIAADELRKGLAQAEDAVAEAQEAIARRRAELGVLERALRLEPEPPRATDSTRLGRGTRIGGGIGRRAGVFILEAARQRYAASGDRTFTSATMRLACKTWPSRTVSDGLTRLIQDGFIRRTRVGHFELTEQGLSAPPAPSDALPPLAVPEGVEAVP